MYKNYLVTVELNSGHVGLHILVNKAPSDELSRQTSLGNLTRKYLNLVSFSPLNGNICLSEALANVLVISLVIHAASKFPWHNYSRISG